MPALPLISLKTRERCKMILSKVSTYLKLNRRASLQNMSGILDVSPDALRAILQKLKEKGLVKQLVADAACGNSCGKCKPERAEIYEWCGQG